VGVEGQVHAAGNAGELGAVRRERENRRIAENAERVAPPLGARVVAVEIDGHEELELSAYVFSAEDVRFEIRAVRAPLRAPIEENRLLGRASRREGRVDIGVEPVYAGRCAKPGTAVERGRDSAG